MSITSRALELEFSIQFSGDVDPSDFRPNVNSSVQVCICPRPYWPTVPIDRSIRGRNQIVVKGKKQRCMGVGDVTAKT